MIRSTTPVFAVGALLVLLAAVGPAEAAFPGTNGRIAYDVAGLRDTEIQSINPDGTGRTNLTRNDAIDDRYAAWSPDDEKVAYVSGGDKGFGSDSLSDLYVMNADGSGKARLTESADFGEAEPTWSPDGTRIAFSTTAMTWGAITTITILSTSTPSTPTARARPA